MATCLDGKAVRPMRPGAAILKVPGYLGHRTRDYRHIVAPPGCGIWVPDVHNNCLCNELIALRNRVLMDVPQPDPPFVDRCHAVAHRVGLWLGVHQPANGEWIVQYRGRKRTLYENAIKSLDDRPVSRRDSVVKAFIKPEKVSDVTRDPRVIQARGPRYGVELGNFLKPLEHRLYGVRGTRHLRHMLPPGRLIAKGLCLRKRAGLLAKKFARWPDTCCVPLDASRFDAHVSEDMLRVEHAVYRGAYPGSAKLDKLLSWQLNNVGYTNQGIKYKLRGGRMSGDMNTALGNCIIVTVIVCTAMQEAGIPPTKWDMLCDGDDTLIFVPRSHLSIVGHVVRGFERAGFSMKVESVCHTLEEIEFCQTRYVETNDGPKMVSNPKRCISNALASVRLFTHEASIGRIAYQLGQCHLACAMGVPVLQEFALALMRNGEPNTKASLIAEPIVAKASKEYRSHGGAVGPVEISEEARTSFASAWDIGPWEQLEMESQLRHWIF